jgi:2-C-methyl-D-erythritol 4-phosphate cytidylyltransferase
MDSGLPKQLMLIGGTTILGHTISRILQIPQVRHLVIPATGDIRDKVCDIAAGCIAAAGLTEKVRLDVVGGGKERMDSVGNGLQILDRSGVELVMVHDAVRPCFPLDAVARAIRVAASEGAALLAIPARDTVKLVDGAGVVETTPDRRRVWLAQTPQIFRTAVLAKAFEMARQSGFAATDDASMAERAGFEVRVVEGSPDNIKITYPADLFFAEQWLDRHKKEPSART